MATIDYPTLKRMFHDRDKMVRVFCLKVAARDRLPQIDEFVLEGLADERPEVIRAALGGVPHCMTPQVVTRALEMLGHASPSIRQQVLHALEGRRGETIGDALIGYLRREQDANLLATAIKLVGGCRDDRFLPLLKAFLTYEDDRVRANAVEALAMLDHLEVIEVLKALVSDRNNRVRANAIKGLWNRGVRFGLNTLPEELRSPNPKKRASVAYVLGEIKEERSADLLVPLLRDPAPMVRNRATLSLGRLGSSRLIPSILDAYFREGDPGVRQVMIDTCLGLSTEMTVERLTERFATETDPRVRSHIVTNLKGCRPALLIPFLTRAIRDLDARVRANAVEILGQQNDPMLSELILPLLNDSHNRVRSNAAMALWRLGGTVAILTLRQMLRSSQKPMRLSATYALGEIGAIQFGELLQDMANDQDPEVRKGAVRALAKVRRMA